ncbi:MAG: hypothetical protein JO328_11425 [Hyphomicrobiales bacterium]|nr:hypothetical protein [Hyphomicrobiales bacterium]MBV8824595.1 hypothetical protein [Hyphomicrobiales bacterium]
MQRALAAILVCLGLVLPASAKPLRTTGHEVFCANAHDLMDYAAAVSTKSEGSEGAVPGCMKLKRGLRYRVLSDEPDRPARIRLQRGRGAVEGYAISIGE